MPKNEWNFFEREAKILLDGTIIGHPIENHIFEMKIEEQVEYLKSIFEAGCNKRVPMPEGFTDWIEWKLGKRIAKDYMIPYNKKMFGEDLEELGTYWLNKLPNVSFDETLLSCLTHKATGTLPGHACFYYPKQYGYGELWKRMANKLDKNIKYNVNVSGIDFDEKAVITTNGEIYKADIIVTTIPWTELKMLKGMPGEIKNDIKYLKYSSIETRYYDTEIDSRAHWIYYPDLSLAYHRKLLRSNFCIGSKGYWTETNGKRIDMIAHKDRKRFNYMNGYAYPLNTKTKLKIMRRLLEWSGSKQVYGLGRWGEWQHYNSDVTVELSMRLAEKI